MTWQQRPFPDANLLLLHGGSPALVDSGFVGHARQTADGARAKAGRPIATVVNTHWHSDHVGGNAVLQSTGSTIAASTPDAHAIARRDAGCCVAEYLDQPVAPYTVDVALTDNQVLRLVVTQAAECLRRSHGLLDVSQNGIFLLAPIIFDHGTPEQQERFLPSMASGETVWAQAWSEPDAGSDLASLRSTAVRNEARGGWMLSGQKTCSSRAAYAHWGFGLFRSDPAAERHHGLTYFLFPLNAQGITVRPIAQLDGEAGFAEIFLDDVFVPDDDVLGAAGDGWRVAMSTAGNERGLSLRSPGRFCAAADRLVDLWRDRAETAPSARDDVADAWIRAQAYRLYTWGTVTRLADGGDLGADGSVNKVFWSELDIALHETALDLLGADGELQSAWSDGYLFSLAGPIYAGTNEIQRNIIAERILGLPREPRGGTSKEAGG